MPPLPGVCSEGLFNSEGLFVCSRATKARRQWRRSVTVSSVHPGGWRRSVPMPARTCIPRPALGCIGQAERAIQTIACCATATGYKASDRMKAEMWWVGTHGQPARDRDRRRCSARRAAKRRRTATVIQIRLEVYPATRASNCVLTRQSPASSSTPSAMPCWASVSGFVVGHVLSGCTRTGRAWDH